VPNMSANSSSLFLKRCYWSQMLILDFLSHEVRSGLIFCSCNCLFFQTGLGLSALVEREHFMLFHSEEWRMKVHSKAADTLKQFIYGKCTIIKYSTVRINNCLYAENTHMTWPRPFFFCLFVFHNLFLQVKVSSSKLAPPMQK